MKTIQLGYTQGEKENVVSWGRFLEEQDWDYYCLFTTSYKLSMTAARFKMEKLYQFLSVDSSNPSMFWAAETFSSKAGCHVHALIHTTTSATIIQAQWKKISPPLGYKEHNLMQILPYEKNRGGNYYAAKMITKADADFDLLISL